MRGGALNEGDMVQLRVEDKFINVNNNILTLADNATIFLYLNKQLLPINPEMGEPFPNSILTIRYMGSGSKLSINAKSTLKISEGNNSELMFSTNPPTIATISDKGFPYIELYNEADIEPEDICIIIEPANILK